MVGAQGKGTASKNWLRLQAGLGSFGDKLHSAMFNHFRAARGRMSTLIIVRCCKLVGSGTVHVCTCLCLIRSWICFAWYIWRTYTKHNIYCHFFAHLHISMLVCAMRILRDSDLCTCTCIALILMCVRTHTCNQFIYVQL